MSLYEALAVLALLAAGGYAYYLYRSDTRSGRPEADQTENAPGNLMFGRTPRQRDRGSTKPEQ